jgi:isopenicillin-N epimerase
VFLNHGSFGACPRRVLEIQNDFRRQMEAEPVRFFIRELPPLLAVARGELADFIGADPDGLVFVANATTGVNTALAAVPLETGDEVIVTDHGYPACRNAVEACCDRAQSRIVEARIPFPGTTPDAITDAVMTRVSPRTRLAVIDHVTSPTGLVLPIVEIVTRLEERGITVIVDGAHAPGMVALDVASLGASFYTGNCHKWMCAPKGAGFLWIRRDWRARVRPLVTSHGAGAVVDRHSRLHAEFDWTGTDDPSPWLSVPAAISTMAALVDGGWEAIRTRNRSLAVEARSALCATLGVDPPCPDDMVGSLAAIPLPDDESAATSSQVELDPIQEGLYRDHLIEIPVTRWGGPPRRAIRLSAQLYNSLEQFRYLAAVVKTLLG